MKTPFFSIIIPVYKVEKYLEQCVNSVLAQTYQDYELILVDDGSPDNCPQMCDEFAETNNRICVIHKCNGGLSDARNSGLKVARGQYVLFLDSDDFWCDVDCLKKIYYKLSTEETDILIFGSQKLFQNSYVSQTKVRVDEVLISHAQDLEYLMQYNRFISSAWDKVVRRKLIEEHQISFVKGQLSEDIEWCAKLLLTDPKINVIFEDFHVYRKQNENSITANIGRKNLEDICNVIEKYTLKGKLQENIVLLNFMAEQYILWMTVSTLVNKKIVSDLCDRMKNYWYLLDYSWYPRVKIIRKIKWIGFEGVRKLLGIFKRIKVGVHK